MLAGPLAQQLDSIYSGQVANPYLIGVGKHRDHPTQQLVKKFVKEYKDDNFHIYEGHREHKSFPKFVYNEDMDEKEHERMKSRLLDYSKNLDPHYKAKIMNKGIEQQDSDESWD